jgi:dihydrofolate reductase
MSTRKATVTVHMGASLDGFIANKDNDVSWMDTKDRYEQGADAPSQAVIDDFLQSIDCYVMGARTYELALKLGWVYGSTPTIVLSHRELPSAKPSVEFYCGDLKPLVDERLKPRFANIWLVGGAMLTKEFIRLDLVDEIRITVIPVLVGDGILFFDYVGREIPLHLKEATAYKNGLVELWYEIRKSQ